MSLSVHDERGASVLAHSVAFCCMHLVARAVVRLRNKPPFVPLNCVDYLFKCKLEFYDYSKKSISFFNKFQLILLCLFVPKMKKVIINMSSAIVINGALRVRS